jgi:hypothetical protein
MSGIHKFSSQVIDYAERLSDIADAAEGKHRHSGGGTARWLLLPVSGAALYALLRSDSFSRQAKEVVDEAKTRATELPEDLVSRVRQTAGRPGGRTSAVRNGSAAQRSSAASRKKSPRRTTRTRKTAAAGTR